MSLELSGTTGVKGVAGSVSAPSIVGDDTNTGISFPSADTIKFSTGGVERMSITNSGVTGTGIGAGKVLQVVSTNTTTENSTSNASAGDYYPLTSNAITVTSGSTLYVFANYHHWTQDTGSANIYGRQGLEREINASGSWSTLRNAGAYESFGAATVNAGGGSPSVYPNQVSDIASLNGIWTHGQSTGTSIKVRIKHGHQVPNPVDLLVFHRTGIESNIIIYEVAA